MSGLPGDLQICFGVRLWILSIFCLFTPQSTVQLHNWDTEIEIGAFLAEDNDTGNCEKDLSYLEIIITNCYYQSECTEFWKSLSNVAQLDEIWGFVMFCYSFWPNHPISSMKCGNIIAFKCGLEVHCSDENPQGLVPTESALHNRDLSRDNLFWSKVTTGDPGERAVEARNIENGKKMNFERPRPPSINSQA